MTKPQFNPKKYSISEVYLTIYKGVRAFIHFVLSRIKAKTINDDFRERIMLAVTEVNGCEICSYYHTKLALEQGMSNEEIQTLLSGDSQSLPAEEATAIVFAQHYADTKGHPTRKTWERLVETYGKAKALDILSITRIMMLGNVIGIPYSSFLNRLKGKPAAKSTLVHELGMMLLPLLFLPISLIHVFISEIIRIPRIGFK